MIGSCALKARVEEHLGVALAPGFFDKAEQYARRKLDLCNERAGRQYGEDGYGRCMENRRHFAAGVLDPRCLHRNGGRNRLLLQQGEGGKSDQTSETVRSRNIQRHKGTVKKGELHER